MYRVGFLGWKIVARLGWPVLVRVHVHHDAASDSYWADSPDLDGLVVAGADLDELHKEALAATSELLALQLNHAQTRAHTELRLRDTLSAV